MPNRGSSPTGRSPAPRGPAAPFNFVLPEQTFRWILRRSVRHLRLPLLGAVLALAPEETAPVFVEAEGGEREELWPRAA